jgi:hypothetical protein
MDRTARLRSASGQSTVEWVGLVLLVSGLMAGLVAAGTSFPGLGLIHSISKQLLCAVSLSGGCGSSSSLELAYGPTAAELVRTHAPELMYEDDMLGLPVDYRTCRSAYCAEGPDEGVVTKSDAGEPVTLFTRVIDCREGTVRREADTNCSGEREGSLYVQYWAYYPESASLRDKGRVLARKGYHPHDWESTQVRIGPDGSVRQRASSHKGHNYEKSNMNWAADAGVGPLRDFGEFIGTRPKGGWGDATGKYLISGGSHAGNVRNDPGLRHGFYPGRTPAEKVRLVPIESIRGDSLSRAADFDPITPPWEKKLWLDPEETGTS